MGTTLSNLSPPPGAKHKRKRLGRGPGSGQGTTAGKGQKGQKARSGGGVRPYFEGGQMPLQRRLPKRGFKNPFRVEYDPINVGRLAEAFAAGDTVDLSALLDKGMVPRKCKRFKILGGGELSMALTIKAHGFSKVAKDKILAAGGTAEVVEVAKKASKKSEADTDSLGGK